MSKKHFFCYLAVVAVLFTACKKDANVIHVTEIMLNYEELALIPGDTITLIATVQPDNATNKTIIWTSSDTAVATVNNNGLVTAIANGEAIITATTKHGNLTDSCFVTVDYRLQWIGDWDFDVKEYRRKYALVLKDTTYCYSGEISLGNSPYELQIKYNQSSLLKAYVSEDGSLHVPETYIHDYSGQFGENNRMHLHMEGGTLNGSEKWALTIWGTR